jgi:hypothetical protein
MNGFSSRNWSIFMLTHANHTGGYPNSQKAITLVQQDSIKQG